MRRRIRIRLAQFLCVAIGVTAGVALTGSASAAVLLPYQDPSLPVATRVDDLLSRMTLDEKMGQMTQAERGSVTRATSPPTGWAPSSPAAARRPAPTTPTSWANMYDAFQQAASLPALGIPIIYGVDAVHGHNNVYGATIFPHNIGLGATRDPALVQQIGQAVAEEVTGTGIDWDFAPCLCVARNDRWGRTYESFGEVAGDSQRDDLLRHGPAGIDPRRADLGAGNGQALRGRRRYHRRRGPGQHPTVGGRATRDPPPALPGGDRTRCRQRHGFVQQLERRETARPSVSDLRLCSKANWGSPASSSRTGTGSTRSTGKAASPLRRSRRRSTPGSTW